MRCLTRLKGPVEHSAKGKKLADNSVGQSSRRARNTSLTAGKWLLICHNLLTVTPFALLPLLKILWGIHPQFASLDRDVSMSDNYIPSHIYDIIPFLLLKSSNVFFFCISNCVKRFPPLINEENYSTHWEMEWLILIILKTYQSGYSRWYDICFPTSISLDHTTHEFKYT